MSRVAVVSSNFGTFLCFTDSRRGVEWITLGIADVHVRMRLMCSLLHFLFNLGYLFSLFELALEEY